MTFSPDNNLIKAQADALLGCLAVQVQALDAGTVPKNIGFLPGNVIVEDMSVYGDLCCEGTAFVQLNSVYPAGTQWPQPDTGQNNCEPLAWGVIWTMGIMRCSPIGSIELMPTFTQWGIANQQHIIDDAAMRAAVFSYKELFATGANDSGVLIGTTNAIGPQGACLMRTLTVTTQAIGCGTVLTPVGA